MRQFSSLLKQSEFIALNVHANETQSAQKIWATIAPDNLAQFSHASRIKNKQFTVFADNNTVAAKLKLFIPSLLIKLEKQGCEVTSIRVKVQVKSSTLPKPKSFKKLSTHAADEINQLSKKLAGTALGDALARLATKAK
ncbi:MAG: DUF721 domain-containing protein [Methylotenera sp.]|uniref:DciA family protein n=1 Tax=Methylotenera sp. TaxID=2051956 RepID=UPI0017D6C66B|nr:DciA family protein [Methylotenera sp.]NOU24266.1 DUF721 domain-containing protein [Methylotenera sp.]